jgi:hypothetical protein
VSLQAQSYSTTHFGSWSKYLLCLGHNWDNEGFNYIQHFFPLPILNINNDMEANFKKTVKVYSLEYAEIRTVLFALHHVTTAL